MNTPLMPDEIRQTVLRLLGEIAPETDLTALKPGVSFRDQLDIDSMDFLNGDPGSRLSEVRHAQWLRRAVVGQTSDMTLSSLTADQTMLKVLGSSHAMTSWS
jgi:hypothetical protein